MHAHVDYWLPHVNAGLVIAMGPVADPSGDWGVAIVNAPSRALAGTGAGRRSRDPLATRLSLREFFDAGGSGRSGRAARAGLFGLSLTEGRRFRRDLQMATEIRVPTLGESISEATVGKWFKQRGDVVKADEPLVELETEKVTLEVNAPSAGVLSEIAAETGDTVAIGALLGPLGSAGAAAAAAPAKAAAPRFRPPRRPRLRPRCRLRLRPPSSPRRAASTSRGVAGSGKRGQVLKGDVLDAVAKAAAPPLSPRPLCRRARPCRRPGPGLRRRARALPRPTTPRARSACA